MNNNDLIRKSATTKRDRREYFKKRREENGDHVRAIEAASRERNRENVRANHKKWSAANKVKIAEKNAKYKAENPEIKKAHDITNTALKNGNLIKLPCHICDDPNSQAHHEDYSRPLEVVWLCAKHHAKRHRELEAAKKLKGGE